LAVRVSPIAKVQATPVTFRQNLITGSWMEVQSCMPLQQQDVLDVGLKGVVSAWHGLKTVNIMKSTPVVVKVVARWADHTEALY
jgi:hypothetical protein